MNRVCCLALFLAALSALAAEEPKTPRTDLYGDPLPPGAVARLGTIRLRHAGAEVAFSKDGKQLISCGSDGEVRVWDVADGKLLRRTRLDWKPEEGELLQEKALSANGAMAATWCRSLACLYDTNTGERIGRLATDGLFGSLMFSPTGQVLALQGDRRLELWSTDDFKHARILETLASSRIAFTADGKRLAGIGTDRKLCVWDTTTGAEISKSKKRAESEETALTFSPDGKVLAVGSKSDGKVRLLDPATLKIKTTVNAPADLKVNSIDCLAFAPDGRRLAGAYSADSSVPSHEYGVLFWDTTGAKKPQRIAERFDTRPVFAPDGKTLACHDKATGEIRLWDVASGRPLHRRLEHGSPVGALAVSLDGKIMVSSDETGRLCLWDTVAAKLLHSFQGGDDLTSLRISFLSPDGKQLICAGGLGTFQMWDVATGKELRRWQIIDPPQLGQVGLRAAGISSDGQRLAAIAWLNKSQSSQMFVWDVATGKRLRQRPYHREVLDRFNWRSRKYSLQFRSDMVFAPDGESVAVLLDKRIGLEEVSTGSLLALLPKGVGGPIVFSPDGRLVAAAVLQPKNNPLEQALDGDSVKGLSLIETASGEEVLRLESAEFEFAAFTPDSRSVVVAGKKSVGVWDTATGNRLDRMAWPQDVVDGSGEAKVCSLAVLPDGRIATGMMDGDILVWGLGTSIRHPSKTARELWSDLAGNARKAHSAIYALASAPAESVPFLKDCLQPVTMDAKRIETLLVDLDSDSFETRETASRVLTQMRYRIEPKLRRALEDKPSLEMRRRLESILSGPKLPPVEALRTLRAIAVLERIGTPEARRILEKLAAGADAPETREAQAALQRLKRRDASANGRTSP